MKRDDEHLSLLVEARRLSEQGDRVGAERSARGAMALRPDDPMTIAMLALVLSANPDQLDEAAGLAARAIAMAPDERHLRHLASTIALKAGRFTDAYASAAQVHARWRGDRRALHDMALAANALGEAERVAELLHYGRDVALFAGDRTQHAVHDEIAEAVLRAIQQSGGSRPGTMSGGVRLDDAFAIAPEPRRRLRTILEAAVARYLSGREQGSAWTVSRAWANVMQNGAYERSHIHESASLSGVYYPRVVEQPDESSDGALLFGLHHMGSAVPALPAHEIRPHKGDVVLFPAHFPHGTQPFAGDGQRISIAFDVIVPAAA